MTKFSTGWMKLTLKICSLMKLIKWHLENSTTSRIKPESKSRNDSKAYLKDREQIWTMKIGG